MAKKLYNRKLQKKRKLHRCQDKKNNVASTEKKAGKLKTTSERIVYRIYSSCSKVQRRLDNHLNKFHLMRRGSLHFIELMKIAEEGHKSNINVLETNISMNSLLQQFGAYLQDLDGESQSEARAKLTSSTVKSVLLEMLRSKCFLMADLALLNTIGDTGGEGGVLFR